jgi:hypothetical protein
MRVSCVRREGSTLGRKAEEAEGEGEGLKEPLSISMRTDRSGLGLLEEIQRVSEEQFKQRKVTQCLSPSFLTMHARMRTLPKLTCTRH